MVQKFWTIMRDRNEFVSIRCGGSIASINANISGHAAACSDIVMVWRKSSAEMRPRLPKTRSRVITAICQKKDITSTEKGVPSFGLHVAFTQICWE
jgi:hypothetical protein